MAGREVFAHLCHLRPATRMMVGATGTAWMWARDYPPPSAAGLDPGLVRNDPARRVVRNSRSSSRLPMPATLFPLLILSESLPVRPSAGYPSLAGESVD